MYPGKTAVREKYFWSLTKINGGESPQNEQFHIIYEPFQIYEKPIFSENKWLSTTQFIYLHQTLRKPFS